MSKNMGEKWGKYCRVTGGEERKGRTFYQIKPSTAPLQESFKLWNKFKFSIWGVAGAPHTLQAVCLIQTP